ncbi:hypothetical protein GCM10022252_72000 [Streptosporangium oxazolinicum]|uniref:Uncharacterized protein n=1 Tax=Streptosporangium oxazolinicum TaxID=909287 RepID=A0ABP8BJY2_9ACTN
MAIGEITGTVLWPASEEAAFEAAFVVGADIVPVVPSAPQRPSPRGSPGSTHPARRRRPPRPVVPSAPQRPSPRGSPGSTHPVFPCLPDAPCSTLPRELFRSHRLSPPGAFLLSASDARRQEAGYVTLG